MSDQENTVVTSKETNTPNTVRDAWEKVIAAAQNASEAYRSMMQASDALAEALEYKKQYVLLRVLPSNASDRRDAERIVSWVMGEKEDFEKFYKRNEELRRKQRERDALLAKLQLTPKEKALLGIND